MSAPPGGSTVRVRQRKIPRLNVDEILAWADDHHATTGSWPTARSGRVRANLNEKWFGVDQSLRRGMRGLPGGESLARLLIRTRGARYRNLPPPLTEEQIVAWAQAHRERTGGWPTAVSGLVEGAPGECWGNITMALLAGRRGLPGGSSLPKLLAERCGRRNNLGLPRLFDEQILAWADAYQGRTGRWPASGSGPVEEAPGETWHGLDQALRDGLRGLPGGSSVARLLAEQRGARNRMSLPRLTVENLLRWADAHKARTGGWPTKTSGPVPEAPGENWNAIYLALRVGVRGLPGGDTLRQLLCRCRGAPPT
jgi:hypothetical protein